MIYLVLFLSVIVSGFIGMKVSPGKTGIRLLLAFSGAFLLGLSLLHLLPEVYTETGANAGYYILTGFLLQVALEFFSGGLEHGHAHLPHSGKFPLAMLVSLCFHSFIEAMPLTAEHFHNHSSHESTITQLLAGIVFHNIPVTLVLMILLKNSGITRNKAWLILTIFALMAPAGAFTSWLAGESLSGVENVFSNLLAIVIGIFLHISTTILFEASENHRFHFYKLVVIIFGLILAATGDLIFK